MLIVGINVALIGLVNEYKNPSHAIGDPEEDISFDKH